MTQVLKTEKNNDINPEVSFYVYASSRTSLANSTSYYDTIEEATNMYVKKANANPKVGYGSDEYLSLGIQTAGRQQSNSFCFDLIARGPGGINVRINDYKRIKNTPVVYSSLEYLDERLSVNYELRTDPEINYLTGSNAYVIPIRENEMDVATDSYQYSYSKDLLPFNKGRENSCVNEFLLEGRGWVNLKTLREYCNKTGSWPIINLMNCNYVSFSGSYGQFDMTVPEYIAFVGKVNKNYKLKVYNQAIGKDIVFASFFNEVDAIQYSYELHLPFITYGIVNGFDIHNKVVDKYDRTVFEAKYGEGRCGISKSVAEKLNLLVNSLPRYEFEGLYAKNLEDYYCNL